jgi:predicted MPP superfamily phosphohydrolase
VLRLEVAGVPFQLAGLESQRAFKLRNPRRVRGEDDLPAVMQALDPSVFTLLMAHEPDIPRPRATAST